MHIFLPCKMRTQLICPTVDSILLLLANFSIFFFHRIDHRCIDDTMEFALHSHKWIIIIIEEIGGVQFIYSYEFNTFFCSLQMCHSVRLPPTRHSPMRAILHFEHSIIIYVIHETYIKLFFYCMCGDKLIGLRCNQAGRPGCGRMSAFFDQCTQ